MWLYPAFHQSRLALEYTPLRRGDIFVPREEPLGGGTSFDSQEK